MATCTNYPFERVVPKIETRESRETSIIFENQIEQELKIVLLNCSPAEEQQIIEALISGKMRVYSR